jgi:hypothetical protein
MGKIRTLSVPHQLSDAKNENQVRLDPRIPPFIPVEAILGVLGYVHLDDPSVEVSDMP